MSLPLLTFGRNLLYVGVRNEHYKPYVSFNLDRELKEAWEMSKDFNRMFQLQSYWGAANDGQIFYLNTRGYLKLHVSMYGVMDDWTTMTSRCELFQKTCAEYLKSPAFILRNGGWQDIDGI